jgi:hypothetical protein
MHLHLDELGYVLPAGNAKGQLTLGASEATLLPARAAEELVKILSFLDSSRV